MASCEKRGGWPHLAQGHLTPCLLLSLVIGCGGYGVVSPAAYEHAKSLYTLANMRATDSLPAVEQGVSADAESGAVSAKEAAWLRAIVDDCRAGRWKEAQAAARQIMDDQTQR
ncbi:MAG: hypothetical protein AAFV43_08925 [Planctomycetota bacterium]